MPTSIIDTHCHLDFECFDHDREQVLGRAEKNNLTDIIIPGTQKKYWHRIQHLCSTQARTSLALHACYGLHPYWTEQHTHQDLTALESTIAQQNCVAVGECGLDYRSGQADRQQQRYYFEAQLAIAENADLPVVIHAVRATEDIIKILKQHPTSFGMIHSYSGSPEQAAQLIDMDFYISIGGQVTCDGATKIRHTATQIPLTSLLIETDAPDQPDNLHKGQRNEPAYLINVLTQIAHLRNIDQKILAQQTRRNTQKLFKL